MRSCIYCGRELKKEEVCSCPQSAAARAKKAQQASGQKDNGHQADDSAAKTQDYQATSDSFYENHQQYSGNAYRTGYTKKDSWFKQKADAFKNKQKTRTKEKPLDFHEIRQPGYFKRVLLFIAQAFLNPVDAVVHPAQISKAVLFTITALCGAVSGMSVTFLLTGMRRGLFRMATSVLGFHGVSGWSNIMTVLAGAGIGILLVTALFLLYTGIFHLIGRYLIRSRSEYWELSKRLVTGLIPLTVLSTLGILFTIFSGISLLVLLISGAVLMTILTYEGLREEWYESSDTKTAYCMTFGIFIFLMIAINLIGIIL